MWEDTKEDSFKEGKYLETATVSIIKDKIRALVFHIHKDNICRVDDVSWDKKKSTEKRQGQIAKKIKLICILLT